MNKLSKKQTAQISSTRRKMLKKLSYSPPMLLCLGALTRPTVGWATHESGRTQPLMGGDANGDYLTFALSDFFYTQTEMGIALGEPNDFSRSAADNAASRQGLQDWVARHGHRI